MSAPSAPSAPLANSSDTPIRSSLLLALTTQSVLLNELFASLPSGGTDVPSLHGALVSSASQLDTLSAAAESHQAKWSALLSQKAEVESLERNLRDMVRELHRERVDLEAMVDEGRRIVESIDLAEASAYNSLIDSGMQGGKLTPDPSPVPVVLAHAHALARTTSTRAAGQAETAPWPNETEMRQGLLFQLGGSMSGVGTIGVAGQGGWSTRRGLTADTEMERHTEAPVAVHEEPGRRYDPNATFTLDLDSDASASDDE